MRSRRNRVRLVLKHNFDTDHLFVVLKKDARDKTFRSRGTDSFPPSIESTIINFRTNQLKQSDSAKDAQIARFKERIRALGMRVC